VEPRAATRDFRSCNAEECTSELGNGDWRSLLVYEFSKRHVVLDIVGDEDAAWHQCTPQEPVSVHAAPPALVRVVGIEIDLAAGGRNSFPGYA
jgi:hypothetical protein